MLTGYYKFKASMNIITSLLELFTNLEDAMDTQ